MRAPLILILIFCLPCYAEGVRVKAERGDSLSKIVAHGTGCFVAKNRVITAWHTLNAGGDIFVELEGNWIKCKLVKHDKELDLALLETKIESPTFTKLAKAETLTISASDEAAPITLKNAHAVKGAVVAKVKGGNSGGPVLNRRGELHGIIVSRSPDGEEGYFIVADAIREFLKNE